jgi:hypothetical protein
MSVPFGAPQQASPGQPTDGFQLRSLLPLGAAGAGLLAYLLAFFDGQSAAVFGALPGFCIITAGALAGLRLLPKAPNTLFAAAPLAVFAVLGLLQAVLRGAAGGFLIVILLLAIVQFGAVLSALLLETGIIERSTPTAMASSPQPAPFPQQAKPGQFGPQRGGRAPQPSGPAQPSHFGPHPGGWNPQPSGPQPGGWGAPQPGGQAPQSGGQPSQSGGQAPASGQILPPSGSQPSSSGQAPVSGQILPPSGGQSQTPPPSGNSGGPQGTQQFPHPAPPQEDS